jgi:hypothetical protein
MIESDLRHDGTNGDALSKKKYHSPVFTAYGTVAKLTEGGADTTRSDSGNNHMKPGG